VADDRIPTGPLEQEPGPLFLPVEDRAGLLHQVLADVRLGAWDRRIVHWLASGTDTSTLLTILSLFERAKSEAVELAVSTTLAVRQYLPDPDDGSCPDCTCCTRKGCHRGVDSECPYSAVLDRIVCPCTEPLD
jgi:hypothetical protein